MKKVQFTTVRVEGSYKLDNGTRQGVRVEASPFDCEVDLHIERGNGSSVYARFNDPAALVDLAAALSHASAALAEAKSTSFSDIPLGAYCRIDGWHTAMRKIGETTAIRVAGDHRAGAICAIDPSAKAVLLRATFEEAANV